MELQKKDIFVAVAGGIVVGVLLVTGVIVAAGLTIDSWPTTRAKSPRPARTEVPVIQFDPSKQYDIVISVDGTAVTLQRVRFAGRVADARDTGMTGIVESGLVFSHSDGRKVFVPVGGEYVSVTEAVPELSAAPN